MKAIFQKSGLALILALAPLLGGCNQQANSATVNDDVASVTNTQPGQPPGDLTAMDPNEPVDTNDVALENADGKLISTPDIASTNISNNPQLTDFVKLVQAGVGETVLMAYVTNSPTAFNLSPDDIVYLNDLGAPESTVTAMLQKDQYFNGSAASAPPATTAPSAGAALAPGQGLPPVPDQTPVPPISDQTPMVQTPPLTPSADVEADVQQAPNGSYSYFYDSLSPYGNWIDIAGYGPCWQPTVVVANPGWQPYTDRGHWAYTDSGWCWVSDYSWGWAPFHYGRWFHNTRFGWCWAPDTVWGPAWVSWRYSDSYCGWAPLPPAACYRPGFGFTYYGRSVGFNFGFGLHANRFCFVPMNRFHDRFPGRFRVDHREVTKIYNTTIVNNTIIRGNNNTIINRGVPVDRVARATHTDIRPIRIRANADGPRTAQLGRDGRSLSVFRPELPKPKPGPAPRLVGEGVQAAPHFDLHSRVERANAARVNPPRNPGISAGPERRPIIANPSQNRPLENAGRDNRNNRFSQPNTEKPGSVIMRGPNQPDRQDRLTPTRDGNPGQTPPSNVRRGQDLQPQLPGQPDRGDNNRRTVTPPLRPQLQGTPQQNINPPTVNRPDNNLNQRRDDMDQQRQQRQLLQQQQQQQLQQQRQIQQQQQQQQRDVAPGQQRNFQPQPIVPTPRQEAPRVNNNPDFNPGFRAQPPVRSEPVAPARSIEPRPAPPQPSAPARDNGGGGGQRGGGGGGGGQRGNDGGGQRGGGGGDRGGNGNGNGNGRNNR